MHWADYTAQTLKERGGKQVCASGITPSGEFHIGHIREILSAEMIHRACLDLGLESKYIFIVDSMDPLRRVYDFLSPDYERYIGVPLAFIPAPDENGNPNLEIINQIKDLKELYDKGIIDEKEFKKAKEKILK